MRPFLSSAIVFLVLLFAIHSCDKNESCDLVCEDPCATLDEEACECIWDPACHCSDSIKNGDEAYINCGGSCEPCVCTDDIGAKYCNWLTESSSRTWVAEQVPVPPDSVMRPVARDSEGRIIPLVYGWPDDPELYAFDSLYSNVWYPEKDPPYYFFLDYPNKLEARVDKTIDIFHIVHESYTCDIYTWEFENPEDPRKQGLNFHWNGLPASDIQATEHCNVAEKRVDGGIIDTFSKDRLILYFKVDAVFLQYYTDINFWVRLTKPEPGDSLECWYITYYPEE
jgi:hypothetical protein